MRDYKLSPKGMDFIIVHGLINPSDSKLVTEYLDRFPNDVSHLTHILILRMKSIIDVARSYQNYRGGELFISPSLDKVSITLPKSKTKSVQKLHPEQK